MEYPFRLENSKRVVGNRRVIQTIDNCEVVNMESGVCSPLRYEVTQKMFLDGTEFVKLYDTAIMQRMTLTGIKVFAYILGVLRFGGEFVFVNRDCEIITGMSRAMVYRGKKELKDLNVITKVNGQYYINWNIAFRGNRDKVND